jgi:hypothetical protein
MPNFSKDETANDAYMLFAAEAREYDDGTNTRDVMLLTLQYAESPEAFAQKDFNVAKFFFPKYKAAPIVKSILEIAQSSGKTWADPSES